MGRGAKGVLGACATALACAAATSPSAAGDDRAACVAASENGQRLRNEGKYIEARANLTTCARPVCPKVVQRDCTQWLEEVLAATPSIVIGARDDKGRDVIDVRVLVDDKIVAESLDGRAIPVNPGQHEIRLERVLSRPATEKVLIREGDKRRPIVVTLGPLPEEFRTEVPSATAPAAAPAPEAAASPSTGAQQRESGGGSSLPWVLGALGLTAVGVGTALLVKGADDVSDAERECPDHAQCPPAGGGRSNVDYAKVVETGEDGRASMRTGVIVMGVGGGLLVTGVLWLLLRPRPEPPKAGAWLAPQLGGVAAGARF